MIIDVFTKIQLFLEFSFLHKFKLMAKVLMRSNAVGRTFSLTFSKDEGDTTEKQTRNTSV